MKGISKEDNSKILRISNQERTRNTGVKIDKYKSSKDRGNHWFGNKSADKWNTIQNKRVSVRTKESFMSRLDGYSTREKGGPSRDTAPLAQQAYFTFLLILCSYSL